MLIDRLSALVLANALPVTVVPPGAPATIRPRAVDTRPSLPSGLLRSVLDMRDAIPNPSRAGRPGFVHASALISLCPRQQTLMVESGMTVEERITGAHRVMWRIGRAVEDHVRTQLIDGLVGRTLGLWTCRCHSPREHKGFKPRASVKCHNCNGVLDQYNELTLFDVVNHVSGNPDLVLCQDESYISVEIKSMVKHQWDDLRAPLPNHVIQVAAYRHLLRTNGYPVHSDVALIYCAKDFAWGSPYKEYHVNVSTAEMESTMDSLFDNAREYVQNLRAGTLPERRMCTDPRSSIARKCPVSGPCFARG